MSVCRVIGSSLICSGGEIRGRADERAGLSLIGRSCDAQVFGDSEVGQVGISILVEQDVRRLEVAMDHTATMCEGQRRANLVEQAVCCPQATRGRYEA